MFIANKFLIKKSHYFFLFLYITLLIGFLYDENTTGGAAYDFSIVSKAVVSFSLNYQETLENYRDFSISHYPYYYILLSFLYGIFDSFYVVKLIVLHISLILPFVFYKILKIKFGVKNIYVSYLPGILFLSPYFRSAAVWGLNDNIALIFFSLSIFFYLKTFNEKKEKKIVVFVLLNLVSLALAAYIRQYYAIFSIFYFYKFFSLFNFRILLWYICTGIILSFPALKITIYNPNLNFAFSFFTPNIFNNITLLLSIFFVYLMPIYFTKKNINEIFIFYKKNLTTLLLIIFFLLFLFFSYDYGTLKGQNGGGLIYKIFYMENYKFIFFGILLIPCLMISHFSILNYKNNILIILLILIMFPLHQVFQKYLDPLSFILIFCLFDNSVLKNFITNLKKNINYYYLYFFIIYIGSIWHYYFRSNIL